MVSALKHVALEQGQEQELAQIHPQVMEVQIARETPPKQQPAIHTHAQVRYSGLFCSLQHPIKMFKILIWVFYFLNFIYSGLPVGAMGAGLGKLFTKLWQWNSRKNQKNQSAITKWRGRVPWRV